MSLSKSFYPFHKCISSIVVLNTQLARQKSFRNCSWNVTQTCRISVIFATCSFFTRCRRRLAGLTCTLFTFLWYCGILFISNRSRSSSSICLFFYNLSFDSPISIIFIIINSSVRADYLVCAIIDSVAARISVTAVSGGISDDTRRMSR